jgi:NitT/TauT family transport system permease protein
MRAHGAALAVAVGTVLAVLTGWQAYVTVADVSPFVLPRPAEVGAATWELLGEGRTWTHASVTVREILLGFAVAAVTGVASGLLLGSVRVLEHAFRPLLVALQVVPKVALVPLFLLWFGFGMTSKVVVAAIFAYFPVALATMAGVKAAEPAHRDLAVLLGTGRLQRLLLFVLPGALPLVLTGLELGIVLATVGAVVAEYLAGGEGLGWMAVTALSQLRVDRLFGVVVLLSVLGFLLYLGVLALRRLLIPWHVSVSGPQR